MTVPFAQPPAQTDFAALLAKLPSLVAVERELMTRSLYEFAKGAWTVLEPGRKFKDNWHIRAICEHLEAVSNGQIQRLMVNIPPRHMKSLLVSVIWPVWDWLTHPTRRFLSCSYKQPLSTRDALASRRLIQSPWFQQRFGDLFKLTSDQNQKMRYENSVRGYRIAVSSIAGAVGEGGDILSADDPMDSNEMRSSAYLESFNIWWDEVWSTRLNDPNDGAMVLTMQRLSEADVCARMLEMGGWEQLMLPAEFEPARKCITSLGFQDPRQEDGELLWPNRIDRQALDKLKKTLGSYGSAGQLQQRPAPRGGGIIKREHYRTIKRKDLPPFFHHLISWDTAATENENNDPTGATVWGLSNTPGKQGLFKLGQLEEWLDAPGLERRIPDYNRNWPHGTENVIESAGPTGLAMLQLLKKKCPHLTLTGADPKALGGGKDDRAALFAIHLENGMVWLIEDDPDNEKFLPMSDAFPKCKPRDVVDSAIQAVLYALSRYTFEAGGWSYEGSAAETAHDDDDDDQW